MTRLSVALVSLDLFIFPYILSVFNVVVALVDNPKDWDLVSEYLGERRCTILTRSATVRSFILQTAGRPFNYFVSITLILRHRQYIILYRPFETCQLEMRLLAVAAVSVILVTPISALSAKNVLGNHAHIYRRQEIEGAMYHDAGAVLARSSYQKRAPIPQQQTQTADGNGPDQSATASPGDVDSGGKFDEAAFNATATKACLGPLSSLTSVVNPSGMAACYNIPFLDNSTGVFEADIRLYMISSPNEEFTGVQPTDLSLGVMIPKASLSNPRALGSSSSDNTSPETGAMKLLQEFQHVGRINANLMVEKLDEYAPFPMSS